MRLFAWSFKYKIDTILLHPLQKCHVTRDFREFSTHRLVFFDPQTGDDSEDADRPVVNFWDDEDRGLAVPSLDM